MDCYAPETQPSPILRLQRQTFSLSSIGCRRFGPRSGFTIIEILIVLLIVTFIMALAIPRLRVVTREQSLREGARIIGSAVGKARDEAKLNGNGGIVLRRNPNFTFQNAWFASTEIGILRAVPDYVGDQIYIRGATPPRGATRIDAHTINIPLPIEHEGNPPVSIGDSISLNHSSTRFKITNVEAREPESLAPVLQLTLKVADPYPALPPFFEDVPFVVERRPRLRRSSTEQLGSRRIIDLRFSGSNPVFRHEVETEDDHKFRNYDIEILFNKSGRISQLLYWELDGTNKRTGTLATENASGPIYLLVTESPENFERSPLSELAFWVTIKSAAVNPTVGYTTIMPERSLNGMTQLEIGVEASEARGLANEEALH